MSNGEQALRSASITGAVVVAATVIVHLWDPNQSGSYGSCPLRLMTGWVCPLCGGLRSVHAMTYGQWEVAWGLNPMVVAVAPLVIAGLLAWLWRARRGHATAFLERLPIFVALISAMLLFGILRNLPALEPYLARLT